MTPFLVMILLGATGVGLSGIWIWVIRKSDAQNQAEAVMNRRLAEVAEARVGLSQTRNTSLQQLQQKHRKETIDETQPQHQALRNDFDNDWSADRLPGSSAGANHPGAADAPGTSDSSGD
jgi:hypothetical protein